MIYRARLCDLHTWDNYLGYGFCLHGSKGVKGQLIRDVDPESPAFAGGIRDEDLLVEVNGYNVLNEPHMEVVDRIRADPHHVCLLVVDPEAREYFRANDIVIDSRMHELEHIVCPPHKSAPPTESIEVDTTVHQKPTSATGYHEAGVYGPSVSDTDCVHKQGPLSDWATEVIENVFTATSSSSQKTNSVRAGSALSNLKALPVDQRLAGKKAYVSRGVSTQEDERFLPPHVNRELDCEAGTRIATASKSAPGTAIDPCKPEESSTDPVQSTTLQTSTAEPNNQACASQSPAEDSGNDVRIVHRNGLAPSKLHYLQAECGGGEIDEAIIELQQSADADALRSSVESKVEFVPSSEPTEFVLKPTVLPSVRGKDSVCVISVFSETHVQPTAQTREPDGGGTVYQADDYLPVCTESPLLTATTHVHAADGSHPSDIEMSLIECKRKYLSNRRRKYDNLFTSYVERKDYFDRL